jgi:hypothetical protein
MMAHILMPLHRGFRSIPSLLIRWFYLPGIEGCWWLFCVLELMATVKFSARGAIASISESEEGGRDSQKFARNENRTSFTIEQDQTQR